MWTSLLVVIFLSPVILSSQPPSHVVLIDDPEWFVVDYKPYVIAVDLGRRLLVTLFNQPIAASYFSSSPTPKRKPPPDVANFSDVLTAENIFRLVGGLELSDFNATLGVHVPNNHLILPLDNKTTVGPENVRTLQLKFGSNETLLTTSRLVISIETKEPESENGELAIFPDFSTSTLDIRPPVRTTYADQAEQSISEILSFGRCKVPDTTNKCSNPKMPHPHLAVRFSFGKVVSSWFSGLFSSSSSSKTSTTTTTVMTPLTEIRKQTLLSLKRLTLKSMRTPTRPNHRPLKFPNFEIAFGVNSSLLLEDIKIEDNALETKILLPVAAISNITYRSQSASNVVVSVNKLTTPPDVQIKVDTDLFSTKATFEVTSSMPSAIEGVRIEGTKFGSIVCSFREIVIPTLQVRYDITRENFEVETRQKTGAIRDGFCRSVPPPSGIRSGNRVRLQVGGLTLPHFPQINSTNKQLTMTDREFLLGFDWLYFSGDSLQGTAVNLTTGGRYWSISSRRPVTFTMSIESVLKQILELDVEMPIASLSFIWQSQVMFTLKNLHIKAAMSNFGAELAKLGGLSALGSLGGFNGLKNLFKIPRQPRNASPIPSTEESPPVFSWTVASLNMTAKLEGNTVPISATIGVTNFQLSENGIQNFTGYIDLSYEYIEDITRLQFRQMMPKLFDKLPGIGTEYQNVKMTLDRVHVVAARRHKHVLLLKVHGRIVAEKKRQNALLAIFSRPNKIGPQTLAEFSCTVQFEPLVNRGSTLLQRVFTVRIYAYEVLVEPKITILRNIDFKWRSYETFTEVKNSFRQLLLDNDLMLSSEDGSELRYKEPSDDDGIAMNLFRHLRIDRLKINETTFDVFDNNGTVRYSFNMIP